MDIVQVLRQYSAGLIEGQYRGFDDRPLRARGVHQGTLQDLFPELQDESVADAAGTAWIENASLANIVCGVCR